MAPPNPSNAAVSLDTIHALSSGAPPAGIAVIRISGPSAGTVLDALAGPRRPMPRRATLRTLNDRNGDPLDRALLLWLPAPATVTGEDMAELHVHGGRAVVAAVMAALVEAGSRLAEPGEFTRRALFNGRMDLSAVEGLADLLAAETESQRREAFRRADGALGRMLDGWAARLTDIAAALEATIDHDGEAEVERGADAVPAAIAALRAEIDRALATPPAERLRDGLRVAIVGPPNAGKSTLFNALVGHEAAIVSPVAGTTRDIIERPVAFMGIPFVLADSAGIRDTADPVERIGVERAEAARAGADIVLDLSAEPLTGSHVIAIGAKADIAAPRPDRIAVSARSGDGIAELIDRLVALAHTLMPREGDVALDRRYRETLYAVAAELCDAATVGDPILIAEHLRIAREKLDRLTGRAGLEDVLDALFGRFCLGK